MEMQTWRDARARAEASASALRAALLQLGLPERALRSIGPVVSPDGQAYVRVGRDLLDSGRGEEIAEAVRRGLRAVSSPDG
ncbi:hypothetical protein [Streptomyces albipurpureus]|uniref:Uncharacterized protein n=1 Tax=Streptomyces albipurpureus TaxID=2897419 RepID=A0ABT0UGF4_9ACTN|nr:hypothetical protein [Streptomyces sp. CWNU-1]MCM2387717.1 hypothetical protein [Streptomyces sp. CWNU-1]